jgi:glycerophosphoryl diester phosphodiesterase
MLETDVRMTKDGVIIVCHDDNFHRLCGVQSGDSLVRETNLTDLPLFTDRLVMHFSKSQRYLMKTGDQRSYSTLEQVFAELPKETVI